MLSVVYLLDVQGHTFDDFFFTCLDIIQVVRHRLYTLTVHTLQRMTLRPHAYVVMTSGAFPLAISHDWLSGPFVSGVVARQYVVRLFVYTSIHYNCLQYEFSYRTSKLSRHK